MNYTGITTAELEARFDALHDEVNAGLDSLPRATWTEEYKAAKRALMMLSTEFHAIGAELASRFQQNASEFTRLASADRWMHDRSEDDDYSERDENSNV